MIGLTLWLLMGLYVSLFILAGKKSKTWKGRFIGWLLLLAPVAIYMWDYPVVYYQHQRDCKAEGGLRVLIQPEKADRVQLDGDSYNEGSAHFFLYGYSPKVVLVEATESLHGQKSTGYFAYTLDPQSVSGGRKLDYKFKKTPLTEPSGGLYVLSKHYEADDSLRREKREWWLTRNGVLYAKWTAFRHYWNKIHYSDGVPEWRCHDEVRPGRIPEEVLIELLLK